MGKYAMEPGSFTCLVAHDGPSGSPFLSSANDRGVAQTADSNHLGEIGCSLGRSVCKGSAKHLRLVFNVVDCNVDNVHLVLR